MNRAPAVLVLLLVAGCAAQRPGPSAQRPGGRGPGAPVTDLFISPAGEPFRGGASPFVTWFTQADSDQDGRLTLAEFTADHQRFFKTLDLNSDGVLNGDEIARYETQIAPEIRPGAFRDGGNGQAGRAAAGGQAPGGRGGGGGGGRGGGGRGGGIGGGGGRGAPPQTALTLSGAGRYGLLNEPEPVRAADTDVDFQISTAEWTAIALKRFAQLDQNHDGALTRDELHWPPGETGRRGGGRPGT